MFRLRLVSSAFGVDDGGPLHPTLEHAIQAARVMLLIHRHPLRAEIRQYLDAQMRRSRVVEVLESTG